MKMPWNLIGEAEAESYIYFDKGIRPLPKDSAGKIDSSQRGFQDNDVDAFGHAYVSGVFTQEFGEEAADIFGRMNEYLPSKALQNGELIVALSDRRQYKGATHDPVNKTNPVIVLREGEKGRNELFYDTMKRQILTPGEFIALIEGGQYPGYAVKMIQGVPTPVSNPDSRGTNNLG